VADLPRRVCPDTRRHVSGGIAVRKDHEPGGPEAQAIQVSHVRYSQLETQS
jgi:hypothetical protein